MTSRVSSQAVRSASSRSASAVMIVSPGAWARARRTSRRQSDGGAVATAHDSSVATQKADAPTAFARREY